MTPGPARSLMSPARSQRGFQAKELWEKGQQVTPAGGAPFGQCHLLLPHSVSAPFLRSRLVAEADRPGTRRNGGPGLTSCVPGSKPRGWGTVWKSSILCVWGSNWLNRGAPGSHVVVTFCGSQVP